DAQANRLQAALAQFDTHVTVCRSVPGYPSRTELGQLLRSHAPDVVFLSFDRADMAKAVVEALEAEVEGIQVAGFATSGAAPVLRESMEAGIREFVTDPFTPGDLATALARIKMRLERKRPVYRTSQQAFAFLPAKAGSGATVMALHTSAALARGRSGRVLLT